MNNVNRSKPILTYHIASGELYYEVVNERTVYLQGNLETGFRLYGEIPGWGEGSSVNLANMLLEFAITQKTLGDADEARCQMQRFGRRLGEALAKQRATAKSVNGALGRAGDALEDIFRSLDTSFTRRWVNMELRYQLDPYPLQKTASATTMEQEIALAYHALTAMCQSVIDALNPKLLLELPNGPNAEQIISVAVPTSYKRRREGYREWASQAIWS